MDRSYRNVAKFAVYQYHLTVLNYHSSSIRNFLISITRYIINVAISIFYGTFKCIYEENHIYNLGNLMFILKHEIKYLHTFLSKT